MAGLVSDGGVAVWQWRHGRACGRLGGMAGLVAGGAAWQGLCQAWEGWVCHDLCRSEENMVGLVAGRRRGHGRAGRGGGGGDWLC
jgi:hypothetical protein